MKINYNKIAPKFSSIALTIKKYNLPRQADTDRQMDAQMDGWADRPHLYAVTLKPQNSGFQGAS